jgi:hypothetical protein
MLQRIWAFLGSVLGKITYWGLGLWWGLIFWLINSLIHYENFYSSDTLSGKNRFLS